MIVALIVAYAVVAVAVFATAIYHERYLIADGIDDDLFETGMVVLAFVILSASWPLTAAVLATAGLCALAVKAVVR